MSNDHCMDSMVDWLSNGHYDSRVIRSCLPGAKNTTDPYGDQGWQEPSDWGGRQVTDMQKGFGYTMDDDFVGGQFNVVERQHFAGSGPGAFYPSPPRTPVDCWARTKTIYQDGHTDNTPNYGRPVQDGGGC